MALLAEYGFTEGSGTTAADSSGNGRNLTASNSSTSWDANGKNGAGARTQHTGVFGPNLAQSNYTLMCWIKRTGTWTGYAAAIGNSTTGFTLDAASTASYAISFTGGVVSASTLVLNTWVHVAITLSGTAVTMYVNGISSATGTGASMNFGSGTWAVAATSATAAEDADFVGVVDEVRVYDTALTAPAIVTAMNTSVPADLSIPMPWVRY